MISKVQYHIKNKTFFNAMKNKILSNSIRHSILRLPLIYKIEKKIIPKDYIKAYISPETVEYVLNNNQKNYVSNPQDFIISGDWDRCKVKLRSNSPDNDRRATYLTINQMFFEGKCFKQSEQYHIMKTMVKETGRSYWCRSVEDIDQYFRVLIKTYEGIKKYGYMTQNQLNGSKSDLIDKRRRNDLTDEIKLRIDRNGIPILGGGGTHRLLIADLLEVKEVPVIIEGVHELWLDEVCYKYQLGIIPSIKKELEMNGLKL